MQSRHPLQIAEAGLAKKLAKEQQTHSFYHLCTQCKPHTVQCTIYVRLRGGEKEWAHIDRQIDKAFILLSLHIHILQYNGYYRGE